MEVFDFEIIDWFYLFREVFENKEFVHLIQWDYEFEVLICFNERNICLVLSKSWKLSYWKSGFWLLDFEMVDLVVRVVDWALLETEYFQGVSSSNNENLVIYPVEYLSIKYFPLISQLQRAKYFSFLDIPWAYFTGFFFNVK